MKLIISILIILHTMLAQDAEAIMKKSHLTYYYSGDDGKANVVMTTVSGSSEKVKEFTMVRKDIKDGGDQNYFIYFKAPSDIKRMTFMVNKHVDREDDRMLYVPAIDLVKKIAASDKASSFVGSDFSYEDVSGRLWTLDTHELMAEEKLNNEDVYKIKSTPKTEDYFAYKISYISKSTLTPMKEKFFNGSNVVMKTFTVEEMKTVDGIPTAIVRKMTNNLKDQYSEIRFEGIKYNVGINDKYFSERYLKKPHKSLKD